MDAVAAAVTCSSA